MDSVVAIINYEDNILIGKKRSDSLKKLAGQWHILGERIEKGENDEQALIRGVREEAGIEIKVGRYIGLSITPTSRSEARWYECSYVSGELRAGDDLEEIKHIPKNEVLNSCSEEAVSLWPKEIKDYFDS